MKITTYEGAINSLLGWSISLVSWSPPFVPVKFDSEFDERLILSVASKGGAMTHKQAPIVKRIVDGKIDHLKAMGFEVQTPLSFGNPPLPPPKTTETEFDGDTIYLRFKYSDWGLTAVKSFAKTATVSVAWNPELLAWVMPAVEETVAFVCAFATYANFKVPAELIAINNEITRIEKTPFKIELCIDDDGNPVITNCPTPLSEWVASNVKNHSDVFEMASYAGALGFSLSEELRTALVSGFGKTFVELCEFNVNNPSAVLTSSEHVLDDVVKWAVATNQLPIAVVVPNLMKASKDEYLKYFAEDEIQVIPHSDDMVIHQSTKLVVFRKLPEQINGITAPHGRIPVIVFTNVNSMLPAIVELANKIGIRSIAKKHRKPAVRTSTDEMMLNRAYWADVNNQQQPISSNTLNINPTTV